MEISIQLNQENLQEVGSRMPVPKYTRAADTSGIVHIGVGGFHRAHMAYYLHQLKMAARPPRGEFVESVYARQIPNCTTFSKSKTTSIP